MQSSLMAEKLGIQPDYAHGMQAGGATGAAMVMLARDLVRVGRCRNILVLAGENRLTGQAADTAIQTLAQVGEPQAEVPNGVRSEEHTSEPQSLMRSSYAVFCL